MMRTIVENDGDKFYPMFFEKGFFTKGHWKYFERTSFDMFLPYGEYKTPVCFSTEKEALKYITDNG